MVAVRFLYAGAVVALLDGAFAIALYAWVLRVAAATQVLQSIAAAFLGGAAYRGGTASAALGIGVHCGIAFGWTLAYAILCTVAAPLRELTRSTAGVLLAGGGVRVARSAVLECRVGPLSPSRAPAPPTSLCFV